MGKSCNECKYLKRYTSGVGQWMDICEAENIDLEEDGFCRVAVIDAEVFDASLCMLFKEALWTTNQSI